MTTVERTEPATYRELKRLIFLPRVCPNALIPFIQDIISLGAPCLPKHGFVCQYRHALQHWDLTLCFMRQQMGFGIMQSYRERFKPDEHPYNYIKLKICYTRCSCRYEVDDRLLGVDYYNGKVCVKFKTDMCEMHPPCGMTADMIILEEPFYMDPVLYRQIVMLHSIQ